MPGTDSLEYTQLLIRRQTAWWKVLVDVQRPFRWHLRRLKLGRTLEIGCGIGRNLQHLAGQGVGLDHNPHSIAYCRKRGLRAFTPDEFKEELAREGDAERGLFDSLLFSHVAEHMTGDEFKALLGEYLPMLRAGGRVVCETPQEAGQCSDPSHVTFMDFERVTGAMRALGLAIEDTHSFPFPRAFGRFFLYNQFVVIGRRA